MKILLVTPWIFPCAGGINSYIESVLSVMKSRGHLVDIVSASLVNSLPYEDLVKIRMFKEKLYTKMKKQLSSIELEYYINQYIIEKIVGLIDVQAYDVVHSQAGNASWIIKRLFPNVPLVGTIHGCFVTEYMCNSKEKDSRVINLYRTFDKYAVECPDTVITISSCVDESIPEIPNNKRYVINNCVDTDLFMPREHNNSVLKIATSGLLTPYKGYDILMKALLYLKEANIDYKVTMFGDGAERDNLSRLVTDNGLNVTFRGYVDKMTLAQELPEFDLFVQPSRVESFGISVTEAMACGCVPICSKVGGMLEQVEHMKNGILFETENAHELFLAIKKLADNPELTKKLGREARRVAVDKFSLNSFGDKMEDVYRKTILIKTYANYFQPM